MSGIDPLAALMENTSKLLLSAIKYDKGDRKPIPTRIIEPRKLVEGVDQLLVRSMQYEPDTGTRSFAVEKIIHVECTNRKITSGDNSFCEGEVSPFSSKTKSKKRTRERKGHVVLSIGITADGLSVTGGQPHDWFVKYASAVRDATLDLIVTDEEKAMLESLRKELQIERAQMKAVHAYILAECLFAVAHDGEVSSVESDQIESLNACLDELGWRPVHSTFYNQ